jgi:tyrosine-specific transport protein
MTTLSQAKAPSKSLFWQATLLISGSCIGGGMLAMPMQTAEAGFILSLASLAVCWLFMTLSGLFLAEATLWVKNETHFTSLSRILVGHGCKLLALGVYLFMNYASLVAYVSGGAAVISAWAQAIFGAQLAYETCCVIFTALFGGLLYAGAKVIGKINLWLVIVLALSYLAIVSGGLGGINKDLLTFKPAFKACLGSLPIILATFSYQMTIPCVCSFLKYDKNELKKAILWGTSIPFVVYALWIFVIHGTVPYEGPLGLKEAYMSGSSATSALRSYLNNSSMILFADVFGFLAVVTSYLGFSVALQHFLNDCFQEVKIKISEHAVIFFTVVPSLLLAVFFPKALIQCLDISGGFGDTILSGLIPLVMVWMGRYKKAMPDQNILGNSRSLIIFTALFFFFILSKEIWELFF